MGEEIRALPDEDQVGNKQRLSGEINRLQRQWALLSEKLTVLEKQRVLETRAEEKLRLRHLIDEVQTERDEIDQQLADREYDRLAKAHRDAQGDADRNDRGHRPSREKPSPSMLSLDRSTYQEILNLLTPLMERESERRALLTLALGQDAPVLRQIEFGDAVQPFILNMIGKLTAFGEIEPGKPALWAVLEVARGEVGVDRQGRIDALLSRIAYVRGKPNQGHRNDVRTQPHSDEEPRLQAADLLNRLLPAQFQEVIFRYNVPPQHLPQNVAQSQQVITVIQYALQREGEALTQLLNTINQVTPHLRQGEGSSIAG